jgi:hypothetical protein
MYIVWNEKIFFGWKLCEWAGQEMHLVNFVLSLCESRAKTSLVLQCVYVSVSRQSVCWGMIKGLNCEEEDQEGMDAWGHAHSQCDVWFRTLSFWLHVHFKGKAGGGGGMGGEGPGGGELDGCIMHRGGGGGHGRGGTGRGGSSTSALCTRFTLVIWIETHSHKKWEECAFQRQSLSKSLIELPYYSKMYQCIVRLLMCK